MAGTRIFICYRRQNGAEAARVLREALRQRHFPVFMDVEDLRSGQFGQILTSQVQECSDFILVLTPGCLEHCSDEGDWVTREIAEALNLGKNIVPVAFEELSWPEYLPPEIAQLREFQVCRYSREYHNASIGRLIQFLHSKPRRAWSIHLSGRVAARLALAAAAIALLVGAFLLGPKLLGWFRPPPASQPVVLRLSQDPTAAVVWSEVKLVLKVGRDPDSLTYGKNVTPKGEVIFERLLETARNKPASVSIEAENWFLPSEPSVPRLNGEPIVVKVEHKPFDPKGLVKNLINNRPVEGASVSLHGSGVDAKTDGQGRFSLACPGPAWRPELQLLITNAGWVSTNVSVSAESDLSNLELSLRELDPFNPVFVFSVPTNSEERISLSKGILILRIPDSAEKEQKAAITLQGKAPFERRLAPSFLGKAAELELRSQEWQLTGPNATVLSNQPILLQVDWKGRRVLGQVVDGDKGTPVGGVLVSVMGASATTDGQGKFDLSLKRVRPGSQLVVTAAKEDWTTTTTNAPLVGELAIRLQRPEPFSQTLRLDAGDATPQLTNTVVTLHLGSDNPTASVDENGDVRFPPLARTFLGQTGTVSFVEGDWSPKPGQENIILSTNRIVIDVGRTGLTISGQVSSFDGALRLTNASVWIHGLAATLDSNGAFRLSIREIPLPTTLEVSVTNAGWQPTNFTVNASTGPLDIRLARLQPFTQVVTLALHGEAEPLEALAGVSLWLHNGNSSWETKVEAQGRAQFSPLPPALLGQTGTVNLTNVNWQLMNGEQPLRFSETPVRLELVHIDPPQTNSPSPPVIVTNSNSAIAWIKRGDDLYRQGQSQAAERCFNRALELTKEPEQRALAQNGLGLVYDRLKRPVDARHAYDLAVQQFGKLTGDKYRRNLATALWNRGRTAADLREFSKALTDYGEAFDILNELQPRYRADASIPADIAGIYADKGWAEFKLGKADAGAVDFDTAISLLKQAGAAQPGSPERGNFAITSSRFAVCLADGPTPERAISHSKEALAYYQDVAARAKTPQAAEGLALALKNLAVCYFNARDWKNARDNYQEASATYRALAKANPENFDPEVAETETELAAVLVEVPDLPAALEHEGQAVAIYQRLARDNPTLFNDRCAYAPQAPGIAANLSGAEGSRARRVRGVPPSLQAPRPRQTLDQSD